MFESLITAFRTLTVFPIPGRDSNNPSSALPMFPVVGIIIGALQYLIARGCVILFPESPMFGGLLVTAAAICCTGALHLDGFADTADAFGGGRTRKKILEIFKDSRLGTFGVSAVVFSITGRIILTAWCIDFERYELLVAAPVMSRTIQAWACSLFPYAVPGGEGSSVFFTGEKRLFLTAVSVTCIAVVLLLFRSLSCLTAVSVAPFPAAVFLGVCKRKIGGLTGDCLGAANETVELSVLFSGAVFNSIMRLL